MAVSFLPNQPDLSQLLSAYPSRRQAPPVKRVETRFSTGVQPHHVLSLLPFALQTEAISLSNPSLLESEPTYLY